MPVPLFSKLCSCSLTAEIWRFIDFQHGGRCGAILPPYRTGWRHFLQKTNVYQHTIYRQDNSIHGGDVTISVLQSKTSAILKFFFRFRLWLHHRNLHDILHKVANFIYIGPPSAEIWRHIDFSRCRSILLVFVDVTAYRRSEIISKPNFINLSQLAAEI